MPSGKTHDAVTFLLVAPTLAAAWGVTGGLSARADRRFRFRLRRLDVRTRSGHRQQTVFTVEHFSSSWYPYQVFFKHRSRWSHGLIFGTFLRVVYFVGVMTLLVFFFPTFICRFPAANFRRFWNLQNRGAESAILCGSLSANTLFWRFLSDLARRGKPHSDRYGRLIYQTREVEWEFL